MVTPAKYILFMVDLKEMNKSSPFYDNAAQ